MHRRRPVLRAMAGLAAAALSADLPAQTAPTRDQRWVVVHSPGPAWLAGRSPFEQPGIDAHVAHYRQWQQQGKLALGGPFLDAAAGGMMISVAGLEEAEVRAQALADPAVQSGLLKAEWRPWLVGLRANP